MMLAIEPPPSAFPPTPPSTPECPATWPETRDITDLANGLSRISAKIVSGSPLRHNVNSKSGFNGGEFHGELKISNNSTTPLELEPRIGNQVIWKGKETTDSCAKGILLGTVKRKKKSFHKALVKHDNGA